MSRSAMQHHREILMTLYPNGGGETADVTIDSNPDAAVAAEIERIHQHDVHGFRSSVGLIEDRMHDNDVRRDLIANRCTCHTPPRVHGIHLIPKRFPEVTRTRPERQSQYHLPSGRVFNMSPIDATALADYVAESAPKPRRGSTWSPVLRAHPDAPVLPLTAEQERVAREREAQERAGREVAERIAERARVERSRADRWAQEVEAGRRLAEIERRLRERYAAEERREAGKARDAVIVAAHEHVADKAGGNCARCGLPWWPAREEEQSRSPLRCAECDEPLLLALPGRTRCARCVPGQYLPASDLRGAEGRD